MHQVSKYIFFVIYNLVAVMAAAHSAVKQDSMFIFAGYSLCSIKFSIPERIYSETKPIVLEVVYLKKVGKGVSAM